MSAWIEHDGVSRPVPVGTIVDIRRRGGLVNLRFPVGIFKSGVDGNPDISRPVDGWGGSTWIWGTCLPKYRYLEIIAYRIHDDQAEKDRLSARQEMFRKIAEDALIGDKPVKAPAPKKERVR